ncbi:MAG: iron-sulfur cluster assembly protein, partial [Rhodospirillaceae bacterium]
MTEKLEDKVLSALRAVRDPISGEDIVSQNMVSGLINKDGNIGFSIEIHPDQGNVMEPVRQAAASAVEALEGVLSVTAVLTAERQPRAPTP